MINEQMLNLYQQQQQIVDCALTGRIIPWQGYLGSLLQLHGIVCFDHFNECKMVKLNYLPKQFFAEIAIRNFMRVLSERPFDPLNGEILVANMLWSGMFKQRFSYDQFICLNYQNKLDTEQEIIPGHLLIPLNGDLKQFKVNITVYSSGIYHSYMNAVHDLLSQPALEQWDERNALVLKVLPNDN